MCLQSSQRLAAINVKLCIDGRHCPGNGLFLKKRSPELSILEVVDGRCRQHTRGVVTDEVEVNVVDPMPIYALEKRRVNDAW